MLRTNTSSRYQALLKKYNNTCQSCGITDVPLEVVHIFPVSEGGSDDLNNMTILCHNCHQLLRTLQPREVEFIYFLRDILKANPDYINVDVERVLGERARADLTTTRKLKGRNQTLLIESKSRSFFRQRQVENTIAQIKHYRSLASFDAAVLAFPGRISKEDKSTLEAANIEVWDLDYVATTFSKQIQNLPSSGLKQLYSLVTDFDDIIDSNALLKRLYDCSSGKRDWVNYQKLIRDVFEFLFTPPLGHPIWESSDASKANRRDIIFPNYASEGFWKFLRESYNADFIIVEAKNYKNKIKKAQVLQLANYLKPHGAGMFAIITCRKGGDSACLMTLREQWSVYKKLIILLSDDDIKAMLFAAGAHGKSENVIGEIIQELRLSM